MGWAKLFCVIPVLSCISDNLENGLDVVNSGHILSKRCLHGIIISPWSVVVHLYVFHELNWVRSLPLEGFPQLTVCEALIPVSYLVHSGLFVCPAVRFQCWQVSTTSARCHPGCMGTAACRSTFTRCHCSKQSRASGKVSLSNLLANMLCLLMTQGISSIP